MYVLQNKTILLISPQSWGKMFVSKHHYAVELARKGNLVYFLNPPGEMKSDKKISIEPSGAHENLFLVQHRLSFPYNLKFHFMTLFHALMKPHVKAIIKKIPGQIDIVWSFDLGNLYPFNFFPSGTLKIFHPVDEPVNQTSIDSGKGAQVMFSVTNEILDKYKKYAAPKYLIRHGLASEFILPVDVNRSQGNPVHVGLSGNLLRADIDREILLQVVRENQEIIFECWGAYSMANSNIGGGENTATMQFIDLLKKQPNVVLHGTVSSEELAKAIHAMDAFLVCYDVKKDQSGGTNYHKMMEYLATGKIIISNNVSAYKDQPELVQMVEERTNNLKLPALFEKVTGNLEYFNSPSMQLQRIAFAENNTYSKQVARIEEKIHG